MGSTPAAPAPSAPPGVARRLGTFDVLCLGVNAIVGSGVFSLPDDMHRAMGGYSPLAFAACALLLVPVALCFAELASTQRRSGGPYLYANDAFGPLVGVIVGLSCWVNSFISWAANTTLFVELLGMGSPTVTKAVSFAMIAGLGAVNYVGIKYGAWLVNAVTIGKLAAIFCFVAVAFMALDPSRLGGALPHGVAGVGNGIYLALFPLQGFEVVPVPAGEAKNPERAIPWGTVLSLVFAAVLFVIVQAVLEMTYDDLSAESVTPLVDAAERLVSLGGFTAGSALGAPRYAHAIAEHGQLPAALARAHPRFHTPYVAIVSTTLLAALLTLWFDYRSLVGMSNVAVVYQYGFTCAAVPILRRRNPSQKGFRVPWGPALPIAGTVGSVALLAGASAYELGFACALAVIGTVVFLVRRRSGETEKGLPPP